MTWQNRYHVKYFLRSSFWFVPTLCIPAGLLFGYLTRWLDSVVSFSWLGFSPAGAQALLNGIASSLLTFLVFVITSMLLIVQISSSQLTPRVIALAFSSRRSQVTLGLFVFTYTYALATLARLEDRVPQLTVALVVIGTLVCIVVLFWFAQQLGTRLRPVSILGTVGEQTRRVVDAVYPNRFQLPTNGPKNWRDSLASVQSRIVTHQGTSGVFLAFGAAELVSMARSADCVIEIIPQVGDFVPKGDPLVRVYPASCPLAEDVIAEAMVIGSERTLEQDPMFGFRIMVDIASRALSPAINDPTTAVLVIDQIHRILRYVGDRQLSDGMLEDSKGRLRLVFPTPNWEDFVALAVTEIRQFGTSSIQVPRRLKAMLEHLDEVLPEARHAALDTEMELLKQAIAASYPEGTDRRRAETGDRQGMGGVSTAKPQQAA